MYVAQDSELNSAWSRTLRRVYWGFKIKSENLMKILEQNSEVGAKLKSQNEGLKKSYVHPWDQSVADIPKFLLPPF